MTNKHRGGPGPAARKRATRRGDLLPGVITLVPAQPPRPLTPREKLRQRIKELEADLTHAKQSLEVEQARRVAAQRGLVRYMRDHGLGDRVGYDPDADPAIRKAIAEGIIPELPGEYGLPRDGG